MPGDRIDVPALDQPLQSGPVRRNRRRMQKDARSDRQGAPRGGEMLKGYRVIVSGMQPTTNERQVMNLFRTAGGNILKCTLGRQQSTGRLIGAAELIYETEAQAKKAVKTMNNAQVDGNTITVVSRGLMFSTKERMPRKTGGPAKKGDGPARAKKTAEPVPTTESLDAQLTAFMEQ